MLCQKICRSWPPKATFTRAIFPVESAGHDYIGVGGASDVINFPDFAAGEVEGTDETGLRVRGRDLNSGPEKGKAILPFK